MRMFATDRFLVRLMNHSDKDEVYNVQRLRYEHLLKEYNPLLPITGIDNDGYDQYSDSILVIDKTNNKIAGTYRVATLKTLKGHKCLTEDEYDLTELRNSGKTFLELGRAVVHPDYRNGSVIELLFIAVYRYMVENEIDYTIGLSSFHGSDPLLYKNAFSYLKRNYLFTDFSINAISNEFPLDTINGEVDNELLKEELPGLLKMYLKFGNKVVSIGSIDYKFNSCDILIILDRKDANMRYINFFSKMIKEEF